MIRNLRRGAAAVLLGLVALPWFRLVALRGSGPPVDQTLRLGGLYFANLWVTVALSVAAVLLFGRLLRPEPALRIWRPVERVLLAPPAVWLGVALGVLATSIALWVSAAPLQRKPALLDGVAQLVQARYIAAGRLAGPPLEQPEFWQFQFMALTERGWISQYPPGFTALLGLADPLGSAWVIGPVLLGIAIFLTTLVAHSLIPADPLVARLGALLAALSPMLAFHAGAFMNHPLALFLLVLALFSALKAERAWPWSLLSGAALGALFATRPYTAVVTAALLAISAVLAALAGERSSGAMRIRRAAGIALGAAPFVAALLAYNARYFGSPLRFGYEAAEGPGHRLGFHIDPWGNPYGPLEAIGYASADLQALSVELLQMPIPVVAIVALYLLLAPGLRAGAAVVALWALLPVAAQALYWHHDLFMGPRMLYEALPAWCLLLSVAGVGAIRAIPGEGWRPLGLATVRKSGVAATFALALLLAVLYASPRKLASYAAEGSRSGMSLTAPSTPTASLVFVHTSWEDRIAARLAGRGMRVDSIRAALANNSTCRLELYLEQGRDGVALSFQRTAGLALLEQPMPSGSVIRRTADETLDPVCERQARSDFAGVLGSPPLLWQGDLPGLGGSGPMFVRDLGPERNRQLIARFPERQPSVLVRSEGALRLVGYEDGMAGLWSVPSAAAPPP